MRSKEEVITRFPVGLMQLDEQILFSEELDTEEKLSKAAKYLNLDINDFEKIPFRADRANHLLYKYILLELELYEDNHHPALKALLEQFRKLADKAYELLLNSKAFKAPDRFSPFSQGLSEFYQRSPKIRQHEHSDLSASIIPTGPKRGGIEPGFMCQQLEDDILVLVKKYEGDIQQIRKHIKDHKGRIELAEEEKNQYMVKMDYESNGSKKVRLGIEDVQRTGMSQTAYKNGKLIGDIHAVIMQWYKSGSYIDKSLEAFMEGLANDIASMFMPVQNLVIIKTAYQDNGNMLKLMPKVEMIKDAEEYGSVLCGGGDDTNNYRARRLLIPQHGIETVTDDRIQNEAEIFVPLLFMGDYDKVGSKGQNVLVQQVDKDYTTGKATYEIVGIDYGHAFQKPNQLIDSLQPDASFQQPKKIPFKNYSALSDASLSELIAGAFFIEKLTGAKASPYMNQYGDKRFAERLSNIRPNEIDAVIDDYIKVMTDLGDSQVHYKKDCEKLIAELNKKRKLIKTDLTEFHNKFSPLIAHSPIAIDLADNLKKLCAAIEGRTSLRSLDKKHGLRHLRVEQLYHKKFWNIKLEEPVYTLSVDLRTSDDKNLAKKIETELKEWLKDNHNVGIELKDNQIFIKFHSIHLAEVAELFAENKIKETYHKEDYFAIERAYQELKLQDLLSASWFLDKHLNLDLMQSPKNPGSYRLVVSAKTGHSMNPVFMKSLQNIFSKPQQAAQNFTHDFTKKELEEVYNSLLAVQENYEFILAQQEAQRIKEERLAEQQARVNLLAETLSRALFISMSLAENSEAQMLLNFQGDDLSDLQEFLALDGHSYVLMNNENKNSELFISPANLTRLEKKLNQAPAYIAEKREYLLAKERERQRQAKEEQRVAEQKKEEINADSGHECPFASKIEDIVENKPYSNQSAVVFFAANAAQHELTEDEFDCVVINSNTENDAKSVLINNLQQYQGYLNLSQSPAESSFIWSRIKQTVNFYTNDNSSAVLLPKLKAFSDGYSKIHGSETGQENIYALKKELEIRKDYIIEEKKESCQEELEYLKGLFKDIEAVETLYPQPVGPQI